MRRVVSSFFIAALAFGVTVPAPVMAEGLVFLGNKTSRKAMFKSQTRVLDTRASKQYSDSVRLQPNAAEAKTESVPSFRGSYRGEYLEVAKAAARKHAVPEDLFLRLVQQESGWNPSATSHAGAQGLAQLMPGTAILVGVDINDPHQNLDGGARYLRMMYDKFGSWRLALAAYNAGPSAVQKHSGIPPFQETKDYVRIILGS
jgi:soluble lytic murein transglycosylase-like protein